MAERHTDDDIRNDDPTGDEAQQGNPTGDDADGSNEQAATNGGFGGANRRTFMKTVGFAAAFGGASTLMGRASAASFTPNPSGEVTVDPGEYSWDSSGLEIGSGDALVGGGSKGDVVVNLDRAMNGYVEDGGRLENIVVRGANPEPDGGVSLYPGATVNGFVWPEGGQQDRDFCFYTPTGGDSRLTIRNSAWAFMVNNGAYVDKPPVTIENCAAVNNNIAGIRVGHREGTSSGQTTYVRNCIIAVTRDVPNDSTNSSNARGLRLRHPAHLVVENCYFVYRDVHGASNPIVFHDEAAGGTVEIRNCAFYNDADGDLVRDKTGGEVDVTIEDCTFTGSGSSGIEPDYSGSGVTEDDSVGFPLPSQVTGYAAADEIEGVGEGIGPWDGNASSPSQDGNERTISLHASPDNGSAADVSFTVDGDLEFAAEAEPDVDTIATNDDGTMTATSVDLSPDELDSYRFSGSVVDYSVPEDFTVDVSVDGTTTTFAELVGESDVLEIVARQSGDLNYEFVVDGSVELHETSDMVTAGHGDTITENGDGTVTVTGFTGNDGYGDAYLVDGTVTSFDAEQSDYDFDVLLNGETVDPDSFGDDGTSDDDSGSSGDDSTGDDSTGDSGSGSDSLPNLVTFDGGSADDVTTYTFTVSGEVARDEEESVASGDGMTWDDLEDIARNGKVIGLVGSGVDAYRFSGQLTAITVDGDASVAIERDA